MKVRKITVYKFNKDRKNMQYKANKKKLKLKDQFEDLSSTEVKRLKLESSYVR